jgi:hypothetical protein
MVQVYLQDGQTVEESFHGLFLVMTVSEMKRVFGDVTTRLSVFVLVTSESCSPAVRVWGPTVYLLFQYGVPISGHRRRLLTDVYEILFHCMRLQIFPADIF